MAISVPGSLTWIESSWTPVAACRPWLSMAGLTWARKAASKCARTCAPDMGRWAAAAMSHRSWAPAGVPGGFTAFTGPAVAGPGELHAAASSITEAISTTRDSRQPLLRLPSLGIHLPPAPASILSGGHRTRTVGPGRLRPIVPAQHCAPVELRLRGSAATTPQYPPSSAGARRARLGRRYSVVLMNENTTRHRSDRQAELQARALRGNKAITAQASPDSTIACRIPREIRKGGMHSQVIAGTAAVRKTVASILPATAGPPGQSHPSEPCHGLRPGMADMSGVRDTCTRHSSSAESAVWSVFEIGGTQRRCQAYRWDDPARSARAAAGRSGKDRAQPCPPAQAVARMMAGAPAGERGGRRQGQAGPEGDPLSAITAGRCPWWPCSSPVRVIAPGMMRLPGLPRSLRPGRVPPRRGCAC